MADVADQAAHAQSVLEAQALSRRQDTSNRPTPNGECHYCGELVDHPKIFCDADCANDWHYEQERKRINRKC